MVNLTLLKVSMDLGSLMLTLKTKGSLKFFLTLNTPIIKTYSSLLSVLASATHLSLKRKQ